jgi:hypothetical protein
VRYLVDVENHLCDNWCARLHNFLLAIGIQPTVWIGEGVVPLYDDKQCEIVMKAKCHTVLLQPGLLSKMASYHTQVATNITSSICFVREWTKALYLTLPAPSKRLCLMARFRLSCHNLAVETGRWHAYILMTESAPCAPWVLSKMNTMSCLCVQPYPHLD